MDRTSSRNMVLSADLQFPQLALLNDQPTIPITLSENQRVPLSYQTRIDHYQICPVSKDRSVGCPFRCVPVQLISLALISCNAAGCCGVNGADGGGGGARGGDGANGADGR